MGKTVAPPGAWIVSQIMYFQTLIPWYSSRSVSPPGVLKRVLCFWPVQKWSSSYGMSLNHMTIWCRLGLRAWPFSDWTIESTGKKSIRVMLMTNFFPDNHKNLIDSMDVELYPSSCISAIKNHTLISTCFYLPTGALSRTYLPMPINNDCYL